MWVLGFQIVPNLHIGLHDLLAYHHHREDHHVDDTDHEQDSPDPGEGSIEHRGVAPPEAPPPPLIPQSIVIELVVVADVQIETRLLTIRGRGPPPVARSWNRQRI